MGGCVKLERGICLLVIIQRLRCGLLHFPPIVPSQDLFHYLSFALITHKRWDISEACLPSL